MTLFLLLLAVTARKNFSNLHRHLESHFEPNDNVKFKSLSAKHKFFFAFEYAKLNDDAVIARDKETNEIEVFSTGGQNKKQSFAENSYFIGRHLSLTYDKTVDERKTTPLEASDIKLIRDFTSRCVPLDDYEFAGDFDKRTGGDGYELQVFSYIVALNRKTKQTFGDSIDVILSLYHKQFVHWCEKNPALYNEEKQRFQRFDFFEDMDGEDFNQLIEEYVINDYIKPYQLYRHNAVREQTQEYEILKFSKLSKDPQDLLEKTEHNAFQENGVVNLTNIRTMLVNNGYKYKNNFYTSIWSTINFPPNVLSDNVFADWEFPTAKQSETMQSNK